MLQNMGVRWPAEKNGLFDKALTSENVYQDGQNIWITSMEYNALFRLEKEKMEIHFVGTFPKENIIGKRLFTSIALCERKLYFAPYTAKQIAVYDLDSGKFESLNVPCVYKEVNYFYAKNKFFHAVTVGSKVYFIPAHYPGILCYDTKTKEFHCFDEWVSAIEGFNPKGWSYFREYVLDGNRLILPSSCADAVVIFDTLTEMSYIIRMPKTESVLKYSGVCKVGAYFWLVTINGEIFIRKLETEDELIGRIFLPKEKSENVFFYPVRKIEDYVYLFPFGGKGEKIRIDTWTHEIKRQDMLGTNLKKEVSTWPILNVISDKEKMYVFMGSSRCMAVYDLEGRKVQEISLFLSGTDKLLLEERHNQDFEERISVDCVRETVEETFEFLLEFIRNNGSVEQIGNIEKSSNGIRIYEDLREN